ncbi:MAG: L-dopachrome tautomerase-related protein [Sphingomicrobium sp.]|nr:DUF1440 domain-containing protein [Sphingomonadales bacterium]
MTTSKATIYATSDTPLGNGAFTADGRLVVSHHPMYGTPHRVSIFVADGLLSPFPNLAWNTPGDDPMAYLDAVLGLRSDSHGRIWLADMGTRSSIQAKFVIWDTNADTLWRVIALPAEVTTPYSEPNDFVIDEARGKLYIADEGAGGGGDGSRAALIVLDIASGKAQRRLDGFTGIRAESGPLMIDGERVERNGADGARTPLFVGLDGIVMDAAGEWLYLSPLNGRTMWRLRVADLLDPALDDAALAGRMERYADKPNSGGMCIDSRNTLYLTVIESNAIGRISAHRRLYDEPVKRTDMFWPDGLMVGPDGALYVVTTQLPRSPALARPGVGPVLPFKVFRWDPHENTEVERAHERTERAVRGAVAGVIAAGAVLLFEAAWSRLGLPPDKDGAAPPPEVLVDRIYHVTTGRKLDEGTATLAGHLVHLATGASLGAAYASLAEPLPLVTRGRGTAFGLATWAILDETVMAMLELKPPPSRVPVEEHIRTAASHLVFGATLHAAGLLLGAIGDSPSSEAITDGQSR